MKEKCIFCNEKKFSSRIIDRTHNIIALYDKNPVIKYHTLLITKNTKDHFLI